MNERAGQAGPPTLRVPVLIVGGSLVGLASHDTWQQVPLDARRVTVNVAPRAHGAGLGVALEF